MIDTGQTWDNGVIRIHRYMDSVRVSHVADAGKRGKKCRQLAAWALDHQPVDVDLLLGGLITLAMLDASMATFRAALLVHGVTEDHIEDHLERGVDVEPAKLEVTGEHVSMSVSNNEVSIYDLDDRNNEPAAMTRTRTDAKRAGQWLKTHLTQVNQMRFSPLVHEVEEATGVRFHRWCRMD